MILQSLNRNFSRWAKPEVFTWSELGSTETWFLSLCNVEKIYYETVGC